MLQHLMTSNLTSTPYEVEVRAQINDRKIDGLMPVLSVRRCVLGINT